MTHVTLGPRIRNGLRAVVGAACVAALMVAPQSATARPYTVVSCDSAALFGSSSAAWGAFGNAGWAYASCPTGGGDTTGISNRLIDGTYSGFNHSGHSFRAPPGATITAVRWAGRLARSNCNWGTFLRALPSGASIMGLPNGQYCTSDGFDNRGWPMTFGTPAGTTGVDQLVICGAYQCLPGATIHSQAVEVTIDDPIPPSISLDGPLVSGGWVSGRAGKPYVTVGSADNAGIQSVTATIGGWKSGPELPVYLVAGTDPAPLMRGPICFRRLRICPTAAAPLHVSALDAAGNTSVVSRAVVHRQHTARSRRPAGRRRRRLAPDE